MKNLIVHIYLVLGIAVGNAQQILVDSTLIVEKTQIRSFTYNTFDQKAFKLDGQVFDSVNDYSSKKDTLRLVFSEPGLTGQALSVNISDTIAPEIILWSDYPAFDGKYSKSLELELSEISVNQMDLKQGDTLMIKLKCRSVSYDGYGGNPKFEYSGTIKHILEPE